jgi:hypothetical protein
MKKVFMKNTKKALGFAVIAAIILVALFALSTTACSKSSGGGNGKNFNSPDELKEYLNKQPVNSIDKPIKIAMKANDVMLKNIGTVIMDAGKYVSLDLSGSPLTTIPEFAFYDTNTKKGCTPLASITIPNGVTSIEFTAFAECTSLASVNIPNSVTSIGGQAFIKCTGLTSITIPDSVTSIGSSFNGCTGLTSVTIPDSVTNIDTWAFINCSGLTSVTFQGTINSSGFKELAFFGDLRAKYLAGGIGTYTTTAPVSDNSKWTKQ